MLKTIMHKDLVNITVANTLRNFGGALVEVFVPLLLLAHGFTLVDVSGFYLLYAVVKLTINYPAMRITNRFGARPSLIVARLFYIAYLLCLIGIVNNGTTQLIWMMACFLSLTNAFQWNAQHVHVSRVIDMERKGKDIARIDSINLFAASIAPAVSAVLAIVPGSVWPPIFAVASILLSLVWLRNLDTEAGGHVREASIHYSLRHAPRRDLVANFAYNFHTATGIFIWPMYLALMLPNVGSIGAVTTIGAIGAAVFLLFIGNRNDTVGTARVLREGSLATFIAHMLRLVPATVTSISVINIVWLLALRYQQNPWTSAYYAHTRERGVNYILSMEIACDVAYVCLFLLVLIIFSTLGYQTGFTILFILAAFVSLLCTRITPVES